MDIIRSIVAVLGGIGLISIVVEALEFTLVNAVSGGTITDMQGYFAVRNQPAILVAKLGYNSVGAVLGGYLTAKVAGRQEMRHGWAAAIVQTAGLVWGFTGGEFAAFTPVWMRIALVLVTGPAMLAGASIRARAVRSGT
ncbi:MAG: hypothetical protein HOP16_03445 [Acidobacteria bacterium]|nr:hypothetical protein [Acidobacteriota bacterium]